MIGEGTKDTKSPLRGRYEPSLLPRLREGAGRAAGRGFREACGVVRGSKDAGSRAGEAADKTGRCHCDCVAPRRACAKSRACSIPHGCLVPEPLGVLAAGPEPLSAPRLLRPNALGSRLESFLLCPRSSSPL